MPDIDAVNKYIQRRLRVDGIQYVIAVEANRWLEGAGLLQDNKQRPGKPLRVLLRKRQIRGAWQDPPGPHGRWFIGREPHQASRPIRRESKAARSRAPVKPVRLPGQEEESLRRPSTRATQDAVAAMFESALGVRFSGQYSLRRSTGGEWGHCDCHVSLSDDALILLEVERGQPHPEGNVAKLWPWLRENPSKRVLLIHAYTSDARALNGSRDWVAAWLGERMAESPRDRFWYERRVVDENQPIKRLTVIRRLIRALRKPTG